MEDDRSPRLALFGAVALSLFLWNEGFRVPPEFLPEPGAARPVPSAGTEPAALRPPLAIAAGRRAYSPFMSSVPGLPLSAMIPKGAPEGLTLRWRTDFGFFVSWTAPEYRVVQLGPEAAGSAATVYWTFDVSQRRAAKPEVHVVLDAVGRDGKVVATAGQLLTWEHDTAVVTE